MSEAKSTEDVFEFNEADHVFRYNGRRFLSVTEVLTIIGAIDFSKIPERTMDVAKSRGSNVHLACYLDDLGELDPIGVAADVMGCVTAWRKFKADTGIDIVRAECPIYRAELGIAGIFDREASLKSGAMAIIEIKTNQVPWWCRYQLALYEIIIGEPRKRFGVALKPDGKYSANVEFKDPKDRQDALAALRWAKMIRENQ